MIPKTYQSVSQTNFPNIDTVRSAKLCKYVYEDPMRRRFVYLKKNRIGYLAFKGTSSFRDWSFNLNSRLNEEDIHEGFHNYAKLCMQSLDLYNLLLQKKELDKIVLSGHSLGCVAIIICLYFVLQKYEREDITNDKLLQNINVVLMGCPKVGGHTFSEKYNKLIQKYNIDVRSYVTNYDIVPHVPISPKFTNASSMYKLNCDPFLYKTDTLNKYCGAHSINIYLHSLEHLHTNDRSYLKKKIDYIKY